MSKPKTYSFDAFLSKPISKMNDAERDYALNEVQQAAASIKSNIRNNPELLAALGTFIGSEAQTALSKTSRKPAEAPTASEQTNKAPNGLFD